MTLAEHVLEVVDMDGRRIDKVLVRHTPHEKKPLALRERGWGEGLIHPLTRPENTRRRKPASRSAAACPRGSRTRNPPA
ncbi:MAG: hypothetical protein IT298_10745 [Chloroflexi bacterium]|nr:hypothetical protein [Chloroflexota bacterium]